MQLAGNALGEDWRSGILDAFRNSALVGGNLRHPQLHRYDKISVAMPRNVLVCCLSAMKELSWRSCWERGPSRSHTHSPTRQLQQATRSKVDSVMQPLLEHGGPVCVLLQKAGRRRFECSCLLLHAPKLPYITLQFIYVARELAEVRSSRTCASYTRI